MSDVIPDRVYACIVGMAYGREPTEEALELLACIGIEGAPARRLYLKARAEHVALLRRRYWWDARQGATELGVGAVFFAVTLPLPFGLSGLAVFPMVSGLGKVLVVIWRVMLAPYRENG